MTQAQQVFALIWQCPYLTQGRRTRQGEGRFIGKSYPPFLKQCESSHADGLSACGGAGERDGGDRLVPAAGYVHLAFTHEGTDVAKWLNSLGITAFLLKYRLPSDEWMVDKTIGPLQDAQQAILTVRSRAAEWGVDAGKIGILGFSAGGHLASTAGTHFNHVVIADPKGVSVRPDFMVLLYPVISFDDSTGHRGSRDNLAGQTA